MQLHIKLTNVLVFLIPNIMQGFVKLLYFFSLLFVSVRLSGRCVEDVRRKEEHCVCVHAQVYVHVCVHLCVLIVWLRKRGETCYLHG